MGNDINCLELQELHSQLAFELSWWNYAFINILCCIDVYFDYKINLSSLSEADYLKGNLMSTLKKLMKMKSKRTKQMIIIMPLCIFWFVWTIFEIMQSMPMTSNNFHKGFFEGSLIGGIIGSICGIIYAFRLYRKMQHTNDEVISQINNLIKDE